MWLCEEAGPRLRQSTDRPLLRAALRQSALYLFEFIGQRVRYQGTQCWFHGRQRNSGSFAAFSIKQKMGT